MSAKIPLQRYARIGDENTLKTKSPTNKLFVVAIAQLVITVTLMILFIVFMTGSYFSSNVMTRKMDDLNEPIGVVLGRLTATLDGLPDKQLDNSMKQMFSIIANVKRLTNIEPENVQSLMLKAENALASVHGSDIAQFASAAEHANLIMSQVDMGRINTLMDSVNKLNPELLNRLVATTTAIEKRLEDLHEIKINI